MKQPGFFKRLIVMIYDALLLAGVVLVAYAPMFGLLQLLPTSVADGLPGATLKLAYLIAVVFVFYGWFWTHGGQTLGMRAWNLYLIDPRGKFPDWKIATIRFIAALGSWGFTAGALYLAGLQYWYLATGLGFTWMLINPTGLTWHDILSNTRIVHMPPKTTK